jgi:hypothetical protein
MDAWKNTIKLYVQIFLRMDTWFFEACQRQYNLNELMKKVCILLVTCVYHNAQLKKRKVFQEVSFI